MMHIKASLMFAACITALLLSGCFTRDEEITVDENGNVLISTSFDGTEEQYPPVYELPIEDPWKITERKINKLEDGKTEINISSTMSIPYGMKLPDRYDLNNKTDQGLRFPSDVKITRKGSRTFYEFTRRYQSRKYLPYNYYYENQVDKEIEEKIFDVGIFNVKEKDQVRYLKQLTDAFLLSEIHYFNDVLGLMVFNSDISQGVREEMYNTAYETMQARFTPDRLKQILAGGDEKIEKEQKNMKVEVDQIFTSVFKSHVQSNTAAVINRFTKLLVSERRTYQITEAVNGHDFYISLKMPGQIVVTNGILEGKNFEKVVWHFKGRDLADCEYVLRAISVVDSQ